MPGALYINHLPDGVTSIAGVSVGSTDGATTILDGTSDVFKIINVTGIGSTALTGPGQTTATVVLHLGLGYMPSWISYQDGGGNNNTWGSAYIAFVPATKVVNQIVQTNVSWAAGGDATTLELLLQDSTGTVNATGAYNSYTYVMIEAAT